VKNTKATQRTLLRDAAQRLLAKRRSETARMLESCGIPLRDIPYDTDLRREGSKVELERFVRDSATGQIRFDSVQRAPVVTRVVVEPAVIPDWIPSV
jgi:hypothetical protein